ncbi:MAG: Holliday junction branch migration protein RuvA [Bacilli bacterium]|nr:Holliday junction branch migration protein RuvA [Bacilli bacterium]
MFDYIIGKVTDIKNNSIVLENNEIGYLIYVSNPYSYEFDIKTKVYIYEHIREDEDSLYGFKTYEEKELFLKLINVKGLGPKMALPILATGSISGIIDAIERENILYLKKFPKIGEKLARQIILDLKGKLVLSSDVDNSANQNEEELKEALLALGYKEKEIKKVITSVNKDNSLEEQIKEALKLFLK